MSFFSNFFFSFSKKSIRLTSSCKHKSQSSFLSTCIVGSGPSGMYVAKYLLKKLPDTSITIIDELPTPYGLARSGVAPDHPHTKNVIHDFDESVLNHNNVEFLGNINFGRDFNSKQLLDMFDCLVLCYGANSDRSLGNEIDSNLGGVFSARTFVNWYNGHPHFVNAIKENDLQSESETAIIIGQGNVAVDCARIITQNHAIDSKLASTDIAKHAIEMLREKSKIRQVYVVGRRGAVQASFTNKELREVVSQVPGCVATVTRSDINDSRNQVSEQEIEKERAVKRKVSILETALGNEQQTLQSIEDQQKLLNLRFLLSPKKFIGDDNNKVRTVIFEKNTLTGNIPFKQRAVSNDELVSIDCGLVLTSIGYKSQLLDESLFESWDNEKSCFKHQNGRLLNEDRIFVAGWLKRGPTGIIGTNIPDAQDTVQSIITYHTKKPEANVVVQSETETETATKFRNYCNEQGLRYVDKHGWFKINEAETNEKRKIVNIDEMLQIAFATDKKN